MAYDNLLGHEMLEEMLQGQGLDPATIAEEVDACQQVKHELLRNRDLNGRTVIQTSKTTESYHLHMEMTRQVNIVSVETRTGRTKKGQPNLSSEVPNNV